MYNVCVDCFNDGGLHLLFSSAAALSQYTIQGLTLEQCKTLGDKEKHEEKMNTTFSKSVMEKSYKCVKIEEVLTKAEQLSVK